MNIDKWDTSVIPPDLILAKELVYDKLGLHTSFPLAETESAEYDAYTFKLNNLSVIYRSAKITPTKNGQFVTLWKRYHNGPIQPFDITDLFDFIIISTRKEDNWGQFIFPKNILADKGIITRNGKEGKRAMRVYPPWDIPESKQAAKTQQWQLAYFCNIPSEIEKAVRLFDKQN